MAFTIPIRAVTGLDQHTTASLGTCLFRVACELGLSIDPGTTRLSDFVQSLDYLPSDLLEGVLRRYLVLELYGRDDPRNHITCATSSDINDIRLQDAPHRFRCGKYIASVYFLASTRWIDDVRVYSDDRFDDLKDDGRAFDEVPDIPRASSRVPQSAQTTSGDGASRGLGAQTGGFQGGQGGNASRLSQGASRNGPGDDGAGSRAGSPNLGFARRSGRRRVIGASSPLVAHNVGEPVVRSYSVSKGLKFNDVTELRLDAISRSHAQEIIEELFFKRWQLSSDDASVMKKAEDILHAFMVVRTASPYADYSGYFMIGEKEVSMDELSNVIKSHEITRRNFSRGIADDLRAYIVHSDNGALRDMLRVSFGVQLQYVHLAFDGSTNCTGLNRHEIAFTKSLESNNLFDDPGVQGKLVNASLLDGTFGTPAVPVGRRNPA